MADCPRCKLELHTEIYEGHETLFCGNCWGHWLSKETFQLILKNERYSFSDAEKQSVLRGWANKSGEAASLEAVVHCPICEKTTERKPFADDCPVTLDLCHDHGVWLDASEIKQVQVYFDSLQD